MADDSDFFASERETPYYATIFSWVSSAGSAAHEAFASELLHSAATVRGFIGVEWVRDSEQKGIAVTYWETMEALMTWTHRIQDTLAAASAGGAGPLVFDEYAARVVRVEHDVRLSLIRPPA